MDIKAIRKSKGMSMTDLAQKLGMSQGNLSKIENGQVELRLETAKQIADVLGCPLDKILAVPEENSDIALSFNLPLYGKTIRQKDETMYPTVSRGDIVVYRPETVKAEDGLYLIEEGDELKVRRLQTMPNGEVRILTDNQFYHSYTVKDIKICGRVTDKITLQSIR